MPIGYVCRDCKQEFQNYKDAFDHKRSTGHHALDQKPLSRMAEVESVEPMRRVIEKE